MFAASSRAMPASKRIQESFDAEILADSRFGLAAGTGKKFILGSNQVIMRYDAYLSQSRPGLATLSISIRRAGVQL